jgi:hypothetical protein
MLSVIKKLILEKCCVSEEEKPMLTTFPAQALPCSGSTGIISAAVCSTPRNLIFKIGAKIMRKIIGVMCNLSVI